ncbi:MAG: hypothetical protein N2257_04030 [Thermodesulfovibrionales bacterium]|nr:hypothetical protein [Thermodesulfovibrionales bacterium]
MNKWIIRVIFSVTLSIILFLNAAVLQPQDWKKEYEDICSKTADVMALSVDELRELISRCDKLKTVIESLEDESTRKVYLKRLQMCRDLYKFALDEKLPK